MPIVTFVPSHISVTVAAGKSLYEAALQAALPIASSCGGEATCGKCNMRVVEGEAALSARTDLEAKLLKKENRPATDRISCLAKVHGDCKATTSYW